MTGEPAGVAVVIGGAGGLGLACARRLARGGPVLLADQTEAIVAQATAALAAEGVAVQGIACDVAERGAVASLAARCAALGGLRALVHTAGVWDPDRSGRAIFDVNYGGTVHVLDAFEPLAQPGAAAICLASIGGHRSAMAQLDDVLTGHRGPELWDALSAKFDVENPVTAYAAAKRGVIVECELRSPVWTRRGARLMSISPGNFDTPMGRRGRSSAAAAHAVATAVEGRPGRPEELAAIVEFFTSSAGAYVSGCDLRVDGGAVAALRHDPEWATAFRTWNRALQRTQPEPPS